MATYNFGLWYHHIEPEVDMPEDDDDDVGILFDELSITSYGMLLPIVECWPPVGHDGQSSYALLSSNWKVMGEGRYLVLPHWYMEREYVEHATEENVAG